MKNKIKNYIKIIMALIIISAFYMLIGCPIKFLTGISCPGCGMTRACISVLKLDISKAFYYHPLWMIPPVFIFIYCFVRNKHKKFYDVFVYFVIVSFALVYLIRLFDGNPIVNIEIEKGLLFRIYKLFI